MEIPSETKVAPSLGDCVRTTPVSLRLTAPFLRETFCFVALPLHDPKGLKGLLGAHAAFNGFAHHLLAACLLEGTVEHLFFD